MPNKKGFTLLEIIIALAILGVSAVIVSPILITSIQAAAARTAQNNLIIIYNAELVYYSNKDKYCYNNGNGCSGCVRSICLATGPWSLSYHINGTLGLNLIDNNFHYDCTGAATTFSCTATNYIDKNLVLTVKGGIAPNNAPIVLTGGKGCLTTGGAQCNPTCASDSTAYCP